MVLAHQNPNYNSSKNGNFTILHVLYLGGGDQQGILREFLVALGREREGDHCTKRPTFTCFLENVLF